MPPFPRLDAPTRLFYPLPYATPSKALNSRSNPKSYLPRVALDIDQRYNHIPDTSSLAVRTSGLLGEQYLALNIGFEDPDLGTNILKNGNTIQDTKSAMVLEDLIGQFLYKSNSGDNKNNGDAKTPSEGNNNASHPDAAH